MTLSSDFIDRIKLMLESTNELHLHAFKELALEYERALWNRRVVIRKQHYVIRTEREASGIRVSMEPITPKKKRHGKR